MVRALAIAPLAGLLVFVLAALWWEVAPPPRVVPWLAVIMVPFVYGAAVAFVLPVFWLVPKARRPSLGVAALWGAFSAIPAASIFGRIWLRPEVWTGFAIAGAASGLLYRFLISPPTRWKLLNR